MPAEWVEWFPLQQRSQFVKNYCYSFSAGSFQQPISLCHSYSSRLMDIRRRKGVLYQNAEGVIPAVSFRAAMLRDGARIPSDRACLPKTIPILIEEEAGAEGGGEEEAGPECGDLCGGVIELASKQHMGWQTSYRRQTPEQKEFKGWSLRFNRMKERWQKTSVHLKAGQTRQSIQGRLARQLVWKQRRRIRRP